MEHDPSPYKLLEAALASASEGGQDGAPTMDWEAATGAAVPLTRQNVERHLSNLRKSTVDESMRPAGMPRRQEDVDAALRELLNPSPRQEPSAPRPRPRSPPFGSPHETGPASPERKPVAAQGVFRRSSGPSLAPLLPSGREPLSTLTQAPAGPRLSWTSEPGFNLLVSLEDGFTRELFVPSPSLELYLYRCPLSPVTAILDTGAEMSAIGENHWSDWLSRCPFNLADRWCSNSPSSHFTSPGGCSRFIGMAKNVPLFAKAGEDALVMVDFMVIEGHQNQILLGQPFMRKHRVVIAQGEETVLRFQAKTRASEFNAEETVEVRTKLKPSAWVEARPYHYGDTE